ncbi:MAG: CPBP family intramembrane glutamic endopeptidase [Pseudomonadota bacterium]
MERLSDHPPFERYVTPARRQLGWWRPVAGFGLIIAAWVLSVLATLGVYASVISISTGNVDAGMLALTRIEDGGDPVAILVVLVSFGGIWLGCLLAQRLFHALPFRALTGPLNRGGFLRGTLIGIGFACLTILVSAFFVGAPTRAMPLGEWALFAVPVLLLVFVQATGEELIFRGYLLQQIAARVRSPLVWAVLPSFGFGLVHFNAALPDGGGLFYVAITFMTGLALVVCVWRTGDLWAASGLHVGINLTGLLFVGSEGILWGTQLWTFAANDLAGIFLIDVVASAALLAFLLSPLGRVLAPPR